MSLRDARVCKCEPLSGADELSDGSLHNWLCEGVRREHLSVRRLRNHDAGLWKRRVGLQLLGYLSTRDAQLRLGRLNTGGSGANRALQAASAFSQSPPS